ncbi:MAG: Glu-tRNA(Gln) amidotransferase subunit GatE [Thermoproteota archaeon]|jgi:glutamyl-tRNA(Gln) amidotransferase subunit E
MSTKEPEVTIGFEWHQRLKTHKLFCDCPSILGLKPESRIMRHMRLSYSELGEQDPAAVLEAKRARKFYYDFSSMNSCLVELDEAPPHEINEEALRIAFKIALMFRMQILDEIRVMRKVVLDGSNTTGFQRTALVAIGTKESFLETKEGNVRLKTLCLEEESAFIEETEREEAIYRLDRLGIPLIELATEPDIHSAEQAIEVAEKVGLMLRLTGDVQRGLGSIRQDLNISITGGSRQEIKGVQELELIPDIINYEIERQRNLIKIKDELNSRKVKKIEFNYFDVTNALKKSNSKLVKEALTRGEKAYLLPLPGLEGLLGMQIQPKRRFGTELADYARVWGGVRGILHSDELPGYGITAEEVSLIRNEVNLNKDSAFVIVFSDARKAELALKAVLNRVNAALEGVPSETRKANPDGTTSYLRPLPGAARMYPETDLLPIVVRKSIIEELKTQLPPAPEEVMKQIVGYGVSEQMARQLIRSPDLQTFYKLVKENVDPVFVSSVLLNMIPSLRRSGVRTDEISESDLCSLLLAFSKEKLPKEAIEEALILLSEGEEVSSVVSKIKNKVVGEEEVRKTIQQIVLEKKELIDQRGKDAIKPLMGLAMERLRGKAQGSLVYELLKEEIEKVMK